MTRLAEDATERERIQLSLARLQKLSADVWWLTQPGVLTLKRGDVIFPLLAPVVPVRSCSPLSGLWRLEWASWASRSTSRPGP